MAAVEVVRDLGPVAGAAQDALMALLSDERPSLRRAACLALAGLGEGASAEVLSDALMRVAHDPVYKVRKAAAWGLHRVGLRMEAEATGGSWAELPSVPEWVGELATRLDAHVTPRSGAFVLTLPVGEGRLQRVRLSVSQARSTLTISTECGPLDPERYAWALEENLDIDLGRLALRHETKTGRQDELVLLATVPLEEAVPSATADLVLHLARRGDGYEREITGRDDR